MAIPEIRLRKGSKLDNATLAAIALAFCHSLSIDACAARTGVSRKRVRDIYIELRDRLAEPRFARWHRANAILPRIPDSGTLVLVKSAFFDVLAECHGNERCFKNFEAENRKTRICRACPLRSHMSGPLMAKEAVAAIDAVRALYRSLGLYGERDADPVRLFRKKFIHMAACASVSVNTRRLRNGLPNFEDRSELSLRSLFETLIVDMIEDQAPFPAA